MRRDRAGGGRIGTRTVAALTAGMVVGFLAGDLLPEVVDGLHEDRGMSETAAGALVTAIMLAAAVAGLIFARRADRPGRIRTAITGAALTAGGYAVAALVPGGLLLAAASVVAGFGAGIVLAAATAAISATSDPDRASGATVLCNGVVGAVLLFLLPQITDGEVTPILLVLGAIGALAVPFLRWLPEESVAAQQGAGGPLPAFAVGTALFAGTVVFDISDTGMWAFTGELGTEQVGLSEYAMGIVLFAAGLVGLLGAATQLRLGDRVGRFLPIVVLVVVDTVVKVALITSTSATSFTVLQLAWNFCSAALFAFLLAAGASLDDAGRWAAGIGAAFALGDALGPLALGLVADTGGPSAVLWLNIVVGAFALVLIGWAAQAMDRREAATRQPVRQ